MKNFLIDESQVAAHYNVLNRIGCLGATPEAGFLRAAYSDEETAAMKHFEAAAKALGGLVRWDEIGNLFLEWPGTNSEFVEFGSHLDTVPSGGNFDGAAGIVSGFLAIEKILEINPAQRRGLRLRIWRGEESATFNAVYAGSRGAFGCFDAKTLTNEFRGKSLQDAMRSQGANPELLKNGVPTIGQDEIDQIRSHIELHIEQGNVLEVQKVDIGIVTSIRGPRRYRIVLHGEFDHSGATPMGISYRRDCNLALAYILVEIDKLATGEISQGRDLVQTVGVINSSKDFNDRNPIVYENAVPKVSGYGYFYLDVRSSSTDYLASYSEKVCADINRVATEFGVHAEISLISQSAAMETVDGEIQKLSESNAALLNISSVRLPSGAGHDTAIVGAQKRSNGTTVPVEMVFIPCKAGKSHCPEEFATFEEIAKGASVLAKTGFDLAIG